MCHNVHIHKLVHLYVTAPMCYKPQYLSIQCLCEVPAIIILTVIFDVDFIIFMSWPSESSLSYSSP